MRSAQALSPAPRLPFRPNRLEVKPAGPRFSNIAETPQLFADIPQADVSIILAAAQLLKFSRQETVFRSGEMIQRVLLLTEGSVKITLVDENGCAVILRLVGPGEILGTIGGARCGSNYSSAEAREETQAYVWSIASFEALSERFPTFRRNSMRILAKCLQDLEVRFREISTETVAFRLSREVSRLIPRVGRRVDQGDIEINLSREELAQMTATTLFTVSRLLSKWEQKGIVSLRRLAVVVRDPVALANISGAK
jgi:CRP-like cAMP-binding protein